MTTKQNLKQSKKAYRQRYYEENKEAIARKHKACREYHKEETKLQDNNYREKNKETIKEKPQQYYQENKVCIKYRENPKTQLDS